MIDIKGGSKDPRATRLSNFTDRPFSFQGTPCAGIEGVLQALKEPNPEVQLEICAMSGKEAKKAGLERDNWKDGQTLWWQGFPYPRNSREYQILITLIYDSVYNQDPSFRLDLLNLGHEDICHSIGNTDQRDTVLTEVEMVYQLNRLRFRALRH